MIREINSEGLEIIKKNEALSLERYKCPSGVWSIGWGNTSHALEHKKISEEQAEEFLQEDLQEVYSYLAYTLRGIPLTSNQYSALVSLTFNIGIGNFLKSTLLRKLKVQDYEGAEKEFRKWVYSKGKKLGGLVKRREEERQLFAKKEL